jgi:hypothetical protein
MSNHLPPSGNEDTPRDGGLKPALQPRPPVATGTPFPAFASAGASSDPGNRLTGTVRDLLQQAGGDAARCGPLWRPLLPETRTQPLPLLRSAS